MYFFGSCVLLIAFTAKHLHALSFGKKAFNCGPYGFVCEGNKVRICEGENLVGPAFLCPENTVCNEDSSTVCENYINYIGPTSINRGLRCHRNERVADPSVPGCKGYILCIPNKNRFQGIKFKCTGNTIFNGYTRSCSSPQKYKCPVENTSKSSLELFIGQNRRLDSYGSHLKDTQRISDEIHKTRPIECKNYKLRVTNDENAVRATYFCPKTPSRGEATVKCTIFSNQFCVTLEKDNEDQFMLESGAAYRKPRI